MIVRADQLSWRCGGPSRERDRTSSSMHGGSSLKPPRRRRRRPADGARLSRGGAGREEGRGRQAAPPRILTASDRDLRVPRTEIPRAMPASKRRPSPMSTRGRFHSRPSPLHCWAPSRRRGHPGPRARAPRMRPSPSVLWPAPAPALA